MSRLPLLSAHGYMRLLRSAGKPPLYFQHQGHSRTIVGIEREACTQAPSNRDRDAYTLLVLDPGLPHGKLMTALQGNTGWQVYPPHLCALSGAGLPSGPANLL